MKKILLLIDSLGSGGAQRQIVGLAQLLKINKYNVKVIAWIQRENDTFLLDDLEDSKIPYKYDFRLISKYTRYIYLSKIINKEKPNIIISYYPGISIVNCINHIFHRSYKLIVSERSLTTNLSFKDRLRFFLYRFADKIIPNSNSQAIYIKNNFSFLEKKITTVNNFTDTEFFQPSITKLKDYGNTNAIFVGRFTEAKNIPNFLKAIRIVKDKGFEFKIDFYGHSHQKEYSEMCKNLCEKLKLETIVTFHPQDKNIVDRYKEHNLFILPSLWEGYPNVLCEAMSSGLPILASNVSDIPLIIENNKNGYLFNPTDVNDIAEKIIKYIKLDTKEKEEMTLRSREIALKKFSKEHFIKKYISIIKQFYND